ncbi:hypothetical protein BDFB_003153 [Asbolus verrucosus]|uniref:Uncharacterized protein n=1 Tax=Asbolus verrucosus TaxID=1661398 RepID=A0A482VRK8_ASBVE|nr:hypothetical protein BDFB_003153 [Asbolus verrucosus]
MQMNRKIVLRDVHQVAHFGQCFIAVNPAVIKGGFEERLSNFFNLTKNLQSVDILKLLQHKVVPDWFRETGAGPWRFRTHGQSGPLRRSALLERVSGQLHQVREKVKRETSAPLDLNYFIVIIISNNK